MERILTTPRHLWIYLLRPSSKITSRIRTLQYWSDSSSLASKEIQRLGVMWDVITRTVDGFQWIFPKLLNGSSRPPNKGLLTLSVN